jgi:L-threonylcarbamoyladenylate synthase
VPDPIVYPAYSGVALDHAAQSLRSGELVVVPTDTVYGLAAAYSHPEVVGRIFAVKGRPQDRPIPLLVDRIEDVEVVASSIPATARVLIERFWPGGLTLALPKRPAVPDVITAGGPTIAVRMPDHAVPRALIRRLGEPLPTTSANRSGEPSPATADAARQALGKDVSVILDAGPAPGGIDSTVVDATTDPLTVLRVGAISVEALEAALRASVVVVSRR